MAAANTRVVPVAVETTYNLQWTNIIAGAICASALAFVLHAFAGAIGISLSSTALPWSITATTHRVRINHPNRNQGALEPPVGRSIPSKPRLQAAANSLSLPLSVST